MTAHEDERTIMRRGERLVAGLLLLSIAAAAGLVVIYWRGGQPQLEGLCLAVAIGSIGGALIFWAHRLLVDVTVVEPLPEPPPSAETDRFEDEVDRDHVMERRPFLRRLLLGSFGALGLAFLFPIRSLGPRPGNALRVTPWKRGLRLVDRSGRIITADEVPDGGLVTVFPEGHTDAADAVAVLMRVDPKRLEPVPGREDWSPDGLIAFSKLCTHAGCPVGLFLADSATLLCPCHQSEFEVLSKAEPISGPAARPLPQLPLALNDDGTIMATGDFSDPVGPAWWTR